MVDAEQELAGIGVDRDRSRAALHGPEYRPYIELGLGPEAADCLVHQLEDLLRRLDRVEAQRMGRAHDPFRMEVEVGAAALEGTAAVKYDRAQPEGMIARAQDRRVALVPRAVPIGERVHFSCLRLGSGRF